MLNPYPILFEKNEIIAHFKSTVMILQGGTIVIAGSDFEE